MIERVFGHFFIAGFDLLGGQLQDVGTYGFFNKARQVPFFPPPWLARNIREDWSVSAETATFSVQYS